MNESLCILAMGPTVAGSNPTERDGLSRVTKSLACASFGREVKPRAHVVDLQHVQEPYAA
jgi:hypothetical protein